MKKLNVLLVIVVLAVSSCKKDVVIIDATKNTLETPTSYVSTNFANNAAIETLLTEQLSQLTNYMNTAQDVNVKLQKDSLHFFFALNGNPSLKSITGNYFINLIENNWMDEMVTASQNLYDPSNGASATIGGVFAGRLLNARAKENIQEIDKGMYMAALYNHFVRLSDEEITDITIDKMLAVLGGNPSFPNSYTANVSQPDTDILKYVSRRDKNDGSGFYIKIKNAFLKLRAAVSAQDNYEVEVQEALGEIRNNVEKAMVATTINYCYAAISKLSATNLADADKAAALHDLSEAVGFIHGVKAVPANARIISDAQVDEVLNLLLAPHTSKGEMYMFISEPARHLPKLTTAQNKLKSIYNFSDAQMEGFKSNWVSVQGR